VDTINERLVISGALSELETAHDWSKSLLEKTSLPDPDKHNVLLAVSEAVTNAIRHGCKEVADMSVHLSFNYDGRAVTIAVHDDGNGFKPEHVPDPTEESRLLQAGGRGVYLLRALAHDVRFDSSSSGTTVTFKFARD
jgi:serine/threonine-protein kinase RsbW